jgi:hypothetical protein
LTYKIKSNQIKSNQIKSNYIDVVIEKTCRKKQGILIIKHVVIMETKGIELGIHYTSKVKKNCCYKKWKCKCFATISAELLRELPPL